MPEPAEICDLEHYGVVGYLHLSPFQMPGTATPHLVRAGTMQTFCNRDVTARYSDNSRAHLIPRADFEKSRRRFNICARCWSRYHGELGDGVGPQEKIDPVAEAGWRILPVREVVEISTGRVWTPAFILERNGYRGEPVQIALDARDVKIDGTPKMYRGGCFLDGKRYAYFDEDRESAAAEARAEITMHRRRLEEAQANLAKIYSETIDSDHEIADNNLWKEYEMQDGYTSEIARFTNAEDGVGSVVRDCGNGYFEVVAFDTDVDEDQTDGIFFRTLISSREAAIARAQEIE